ncbi:hypothetical protein [Anaerovibrio sp. RM50]|uniref:hypothetical protein n=1 Tax=Anaerovibrio sp. RM50 TaxID=1200557 RepID=UPI00047FAE97|nr:hypothetical protein [Anaerovibrio sp. RM50]
MIIDYEEFQELLQQRREMNGSDWDKLLGNLNNDENVVLGTVESGNKYTYRDVAAIALLHRRFGSWDRMMDELINKYPFADMKGLLGKYSKLDQYSDKNIRKISNRLSVNDLIIIMLWYDHWTVDPNDKYRRRPKSCYNTVCALNKVVSATVRTALNVKAGFPLNASTMNLDGIIAVLECLSESEWDNQQFCYISEKHSSIEEALLVLEAMDAPLVEMTKGQIKAAVSVFPDYNGYNCHPSPQATEQELADWFDKLVCRQLELLAPEGKLALMLDAEWADYPVVQELIKPYMAKEQVGCIFNIPATEYAKDRFVSFKLADIRCIVFAQRSANEKVKVIDFSDLLNGKDYKVLADEKILNDMQKIIEARLNGDGDNVIFADKEFFLNQSNAYNPYYCNSILYMEKMQQEGKYISLEQLMGKAELPEKVITDGIAVPEMISVFRPVAMKQLERAKKRSAMDEGKTNGADVMVYTVTAKHIRDGALFVKNDDLEGSMIEPDMMKKIQRYILQPGDLLVSRIGGAVMGLVTEEDLDGRFLMASDSLHIIRCNSDVVQKHQPLMNTRFMYMYMSSQAGRRQLASLGKGRTVNLISLKELSKVIFPANTGVIKNVTEKWNQINEARKVIDNCFTECDKILRIK